MSEKSDRKAELERKKAWLAQIRADKLRKKKEEEEKKVVVSSDLEQKRKDAESLLRDIGISDTSLVAAAPKSPSKSPAVPAASTTEQDGGKPRTVAQYGDWECQEKDICHTEQVSFSLKTSGLDWDQDASLVELQGPRKHAKLELSKITVTSIAPKETVTYAKETQTPVQQQQQSDDEDEKQDEEKNNIVLEDKLADDDEEKEEEGTRELTEEEKCTIENSEEYLSFLNRTSRFMERALTHKIDLFTEYNLQQDEESEADKGAKLALNRVFSDERWSRHRLVTCLDWSTQYPELCVASYSSNEDAPYEPDGVALVWNSKYKTASPEYIFHCQSAVTAACFAKFHPNLVVGGTYSGQIVLWDNRTKKRTPAQRSKLSASAHTHPVFCVDVVGTQNAHNLISISNDGKMCSWSLDMLTQPQDTMELQHKQSKAVAVTCMAFQPNNVNNFAVGAEDGSVYSACRHGSKTGISDAFDGHFGPVTGVDFHCATGQLDFSHLFLTSSFDWTVKLWSLKNGTRKCLHSFEDNNDYVMDVAWSPAHPSMFASADASGRIDLWNLNTDIEVPAVSVMTDNNSAINEIRWNPAGSQIAAGDEVGRIHVYDVGEQIASPRNDEWSRFVRTLADIKSNEADEEETLMSRHL
uniref:cytoplasmic dynein 1 intermediate chain 2-like isoform X3 n=1 Tax=Styela clava TaxID=7725 RepID=UPI00193A030D|nr:cytoplasmic dynein 1 intermediate chain 2-like isoform X3 [Styela clava]